MNCQEIRDHLPWYAIGSLDVETAAYITAHLPTCTSCRDELTEIVGVRYAVLATHGGVRSPGRQVWRRVRAETGIRETADIDIGSMLIGFQLGFRAGSHGIPVRASLRLLGQNIRIVGRRRYGTQEAEGE